MWERPATFEMIGAWQLVRGNYQHIAWWRSNNDIFCGQKNSIQLFIHKGVVLLVLVGREGSQC